MRTVTISAAEARNNLSKMLSEAYFSGTTFLITKNKRVMAEIKKPIDIKERMKSFFENVSPLSEEDATSIKRIVAKGKRFATRNSPIQPL